MRSCKCESKGDTYISFGGSVCCGFCFSEIITEKPAKPAGVRVIDSGDNLIVKNNGKTVKLFHKLEDDFAYTNAHEFARALKVKPELTTQ